jgi:hypothetical protein
VKREILYTHHPFIFRRESVFPIEDQEIRGAGRGLFNWALIIINVLVIVFMITLNQEAQRDFINQYRVIPEEILQGQDLYALLTSMFLHGGWLHLIGNMLYLWVFGDNIEAVIGHIGYLIFYLLGGLAASAAHIALNAASNVPSVGASRAVAAVLGIQGKGIGAFRSLDAGDAYLCCCLSVSGSCYSFSTAMPAWGWRQSRQAAWLISTILAVFFSA